jgi:putative nucleotidyltransferase with HDIG domain
MAEEIVERSNLEQKLLSFSAKIDEFEGYRIPHGARIAELSDQIASSLNLGSLDRSMLRAAALIHDIGEMVMARDYIALSRQLTETERLDLQRHPVIGEQEASKRNLPKAIQLIIRWHHEWWNGSGYPDALRGEEIPLVARIIRVVDSYSAMTEDRPRRAALSETEAREQLKAGAGIEFDPRIVKAFIELSEGR